jgi:hypothetical protein
MNSIKAVLTHKSFCNQNIEPFDFVYMNTTVKFSINDNRLIIELIGRKKEKRLFDQFFELYDLLFLMLGAYPVRENMICNGNEVDTSDWTRKYTTSSHFNEAEAIICDITPVNINGKNLMKMQSVHKQSLSSIAYIVSEYYEHVVANHRVELASHTIDGFFMHTNFYNLLRVEIKTKEPKRKDTYYVENVERLFKLFFTYHRKYNCEILKHLGIKKKDFCDIIADTRNDFSHLLEKKPKRLVDGTDMVYFIDLIFYAERLFLLVELLELEVNETMIQEYLYIMHDWIDEIVNNRKDRIKSKHYRMVEEVYQFNKMIEEIQNQV